MATSFKLQTTANCRLCGVIIPPDDIRLQWDRDGIFLKAFHGQCLEEYNANSTPTPDGTGPITSDPEPIDGGREGNYLPRYEQW